jgi:glyoxylase-like metal-dependent hydrolase (beta-lactamase superfamily II)
MKRRDFLTSSVSCGAHVLSLAVFAPRMLRSALAPQEKSETVVEEKWGRIEKVHNGVWSLISTPFETNDFTTVCNGGIIAGDKRVLAVESFMQPKGATWLAEQAKKLTGKWPTDIVSTHFHADHPGGHLGYYNEKQKPNLWLTKSTKDAAEDSFSQREMENNEFKNVTLIKSEGETVIDLGNRKVRLVPRSGHTSSDVTIELVDPKVVWCGDLFFNRMFPNYGDAIPSRLKSYVDSILEAKDVTYVPGHGPVADLEAIQKYKTFLSFIEESAKTAFNEGKSIEEETKDFKLPENLSQWVVWSPDNAKKAYAAWFKELKDAADSK